MESSSTALLRWLAIVLVIAGLGLAAMLPLMAHDKKTEPQPSPSRTSMRTAAPKATVGTETFPDCDGGSMPCVSKVGEEFHLFEANPGHPVKETFVTVFRTYKRDGKIFYEIFR